MHLGQAQVTRRSGRQAAAAGAPTTLVWLEDVIAANVGTLFAGRDISTTVPFRVTRDADVEIREYEAADLLQAMEENVRRRRFGDVVRLESRRMG